MFTIIKCLGHGSRFNNIRLISKTATVNQLAKPLLRSQKKSKQIGPLGWFMLVIPATTFALGTWQVQRKKWKEDLIVQLKTLTESNPVKLPDSLEEVEKLEYRPVCVKGHFLHDRELYLGPRTLLTRGDATSKSSLMSDSSNPSQGYLVVTPFKLADRDETILVNRGWVPMKQKNPTARKKGQVEGEVEVVGIVRLQEERPVFVPKNKGDGSYWLYRDLRAMAEATGASPIYLDATNDFDVAGGPVGGQTRISLRNEHLSYVLTWYSLCAATSYMWYYQFVKHIK